VANESEVAFTGTPSEIDAQRADVDSATSRNTSRSRHSDRDNPVHRVLIFQGGGALGAYEAGVFEALYEELYDKFGDKEPLFHTVAGTSIGAVNATILVNYVLKNGSWRGSDQELSKFWDELSSPTIWHPRYYIDNFWLSHSNPFFVMSWEYPKMVRDLIHKSYQVFLSAAKQWWSRYYYHPTFPIFTLSEGGGFFFKMIDWTKEDWREEWPWVLGYFWWPDNYSQAASAEAARRYYSYLSSLAVGTPKVLSPTIFLGPESIFQPDLKYFDPTQFTVNAFYRFDNTPLAKTMMEHWDYQKNPIIKTDEKQPRLLLVSVDVQDCTTAVTFDSYKYTGAECELCPSEKFDDTAQFINHVNKKHTDGITKFTKESGIHKSVYGGEQNAHVIFYDGITIDHIIASMSIHQRFKYPEFDVFDSTRDNKQISRQFWDGAYLANTPLREVLQMHSQYWENIDNKQVPDLEVYIVNLYPTMENNFPKPIADADTIRDREIDIQFHDKTKYDLKVAELTSDYVDLVEELTRLIKSSPNLSGKLDTILAKFARTKKRNGKRRTYKDLLKKRIKIKKAVYIERSDDNNTIYGKSFDFSSDTIKQLRSQGYRDAKLQINIERTDEKMKNFVKRLTEEEGEYFDSWLQGIRVLSKHQDSRNKAMDRLEELKNEASML
jgi:NTE family protein